MDHTQYITVPNFMVIRAKQQSNDPPHQTLKVPKKPMANRVKIKDCKQELSRQ